MALAPEQDGSILTYPDPARLSSFQGSIKLQRGVEGGRADGRRNVICEKYWNKVAKLDRKLVNVHRTINKIVTFRANFSTKQKLFTFPNKNHLHLTSFL